MVNFNKDDTTEAFGLKNISLNKNKVYFEFFYFRKFKIIIRIKYGLLRTRLKKWLDYVSIFEFVN